MSFSNIFGTFRKWLSRRPALPIRKHSSAKSRNVRLMLENLEDRVVPVVAGTWQSLAATNPGSGPTYMQALALLTDGTVMVQSGQNASSNTWYQLSPAQTGNTFQGTTTNTGNYVNGTWSSLANSGAFISPPEQRLFDTSAVLPSGNVFTIGGEYTTPEPFTGTSEIFTPSTSGGPGSWAQTATIPTPPTGIRFTSTAITGAQQHKPHYHHRHECHRLGQRRTSKHQRRRREHRCQ